MREKVVMFGHAGNLVGVVTEPVVNQHQRTMPGVLFLNAGLLHHVGPYRLNVDLARKMGALGFMSFRFDLSGIGDSELGKDTRLHDERAVDDIREAMDFLSTKNAINEFVMIGLCSGADNAHKVACKDNRISGAVFLDGYTYPTLGFYLRDYGPSLLNPRKWARFLKNRLISAFSNPNENGSENGNQGLIFRVKKPPKEKTMEDLKEFIDRGMNLLFIYSGGIPGYYNYRNQFKDMYKSIDFKNKLQLEYFEESDHTYTLLEDREKLMNCVCDWMQKHYKEN